MSRLLIVILVISLAGNLVGLFITYKFLNLKKYFAEADARLREANSAVRNLHKTVDNLTARLDDYVEKRSVFLHHSAGESLLTAGNLRNRFLEMGILVKSATYGDEIGEDTDMNHWVSKFQNSMPDILRFKSHPNMYNDDIFNDIVMFKSCFPNSDITAEGSLPGDPSSPEKTTANYRAAFEQLKDEFKKYPDILFVYLTAPPLIPELSTAENAGRAREFNNWLVDKFVEAYREETGLNNFVIFDLFDCLAGDDNFLKREYQRDIPGDPHPNAKGSLAASEKFIEFFAPTWKEWLMRTPAE
jgi:hypothetical protein